MSIAFGSKAETLERLAPLLTNGRVLPQLRFTAQQWEAAPQQLLDRLQQEPWSRQPVIVRSSGVAEDSSTESLAGHFTSVANVSGQGEVQRAIEKVIASFGARRAEDQVFIQPMLCEVSLSGVAFSRDPRSGGYYQVINYDASSGTTDSITSGRSNEVATLYLDKATPPAAEHRFAGLVALLNELEEHLSHDALDIEFAIADGQLYLLQVRPLILSEAATLSLEGHRQTLTRIREKVRQLSRPHPYLHGTRSVFGVMPDWNPAEIIGVRPRPLALSAYKELVTDNVWAYQRHNYGYRNLRSFPLLISFAGQPYIDVRVSFNSFIPADIDHELAERLANHYTERLIATPANHDKVEFEIIYSCYTLDLQQRLNQLEQYGFSSADCATLADSLRKLTNRIIHADGLWKTDIEKLHKLEQRHRTISDSQLNRIEKIYWLLEDCKRYGTLPFAGLARAGFIAVQLLKSLVSTGILRENDYEQFMASLDTVSSQMATDLGNLSQRAFLQKYGHLRPGTYDVTSPRYDEMPERYFNWDNLPAPERDSDLSDERRAGGKDAFALSLSQMNRLEALLQEQQIEHGVLSLFNFIKGAIEGRELAKFVFTRSLSDALQLLGELGEEHGLSRDEVSYLDIEVVRKLYGSSADIGQELRKSVAAGKARYATTRQISLPPLITAPEDLFAFEMPVNEPNYITLKAAAGKVVHAEAEENALRGSILMIPSADPGFDWIFSHQIGGFITMYGGANSHMAIRAGELGIPAVIGAGEALYCCWEQAQLLEIDCAKQQVTVLQ